MTKLIIQWEFLTKKDFCTPTTVLEEFKSLSTRSRTTSFFTVGSICPVHIQHVQIQEIAKKNLEENFPVQVVAGLLHQHMIYVMSKYRHSNRMESFIKWEDRILLIELALKDHTWIRCDKWDGNEEQFYEYYETQKSFERFLDGVIKKDLTESQNTYGCRGRSCF